MHNFESRDLKISNIFYYLFWEIVKFCDFMNTFPNECRDINYG